MLCRIAYTVARAFDFQFSLSNYATPLAAEICHVTTPKKDKAKCEETGNVVNAYDCVE